MGSQLATIGAHIAQLYLGSYFLVAAVGKLTRWREFGNGVLRYQILPVRAAQLVGFLLPPLEGTLALALLTGFFVLQASILALLLLTGFTVAIGINLWRGQLIPCECFGLADTATISTGTVVRNCALIALTLSVLTWSTPGSTQSLWTMVGGILKSDTSQYWSLVLIVLLVTSCWISTLLLEWIVDTWHRSGLLRRT